MKPILISLISISIFLFSALPAFAAPTYTCSVTGQQSTTINPEYFNIFIGAYEIPRDHTKRIEYFQKLKAVGFYSVRFQYNWMIIGNQKGTLKWDYYDPIMQDLAQVGLRALPTVNRVPFWARGLDKNVELLNDQFYPEWETFIKESVKRYSLSIGSVAKVVPAWEMWNEPDLSYDGTPESIVKMLNTAYDAIKATDPTAQVLAPATSTKGLNALTGSPAASTANFFNLIIKNGKFDVMNTHMYKKISTSIDLVKLVKQKLLQDGNAISKKAKLAITESNDPLWPANIVNDRTDDQRRSDIIDRYICLNQAGANFLYYFKSFDLDDNTTNNVGIFNGTFDTAYTPRSAYFGIKNMISILTNQINTKPGDLNSDNLVNQADVTLLKSKYGNPYTIYDYSKIITNWGN